MHEYPPHDFYDSVTRARVNALSHLGFTERQREFLVTVMVHSSCFLERQYCAFTRTVRGQNSREFVARLVAREFVRVIEPGPVRRGRICAFFQNCSLNVVQKTHGRFSLCRLHQPA